MRKWILWTAVALVLCFSADVVFAGGETEEGAAKEKVRKEKARSKEGQARRERTPQAYGQVKSIDVEGGKIVVAVRKRGEKEPAQVTYKITDQTKVRISGEEKTLADLAEGKNIIVSYKAAGEEGGDAVALSITVRMPQAFGTVKSVDAAGGKIVVTVRQGRGGETTEKTFLVGDDTKVRIGGEDKTLADLAAGARVTIFFKAAAEKDGTPTATTISVRGARRRTTERTKKNTED